MRTKLIVALAIASSLGLAACGGSESKSTSSTTAKGSNSSGSLKPIDACKLATDAQIASVGGSGTGQAFVRPAVPDVQWDSCTWGSITSGKPVVIIQTQQLGPDAPVNALSILLKSGDTAKAPATPVSVGTDGKLYNVALLAGGGGGGVGKTIAFQDGNKTTVAVSVTGEKVDVPALTTLAEQVAAQVG